MSEIEIISQKFFSWENLKYFFVYDAENPFIFTTFLFWVFFAGVLTFYSCFYKKRAVRNAFLFLVSLFFYYKTSGLFISILLFSTLSDYGIGWLIHYSKKKLFKQLFLALSVFINLFVLCYFKYAYFFTDSFNVFFKTNYEVFNHFAFWVNTYGDTHFTVNKILLPIGISFYTFQTISYAVDIYKEKIKPVKSILDFGFYVSFFPQLVAGPIVRAADFIPQLYKPYKLSQYNFGLALFWILKGLTKKVILGDYIATNFIDRVFDNPMMFTGFENLMALYGYSLQVYADFSGYTDIAIGIALLMGFALPKNFNSPYKSKNVGEFWKRWHISLSGWLKDYLYIPLGGNRGGSIGTWIALIFISAFIIMLSGKIIVLYGFIFSGALLGLFAFFIKPFRSWLTTNINLLITMLLGGLWHGSSWQFVIWGGLNGLGIVVYKLWRKISPYEKYDNAIGIIIKVFITFNFITFTRIWFRAPNMESSREIIKQIVSNFSLSLAPEVLMSYSNVFAIMLFGFVIHWLPVKVKTWYREAFIGLSLVTKIIFYAITIFFVYQAMSSETQPFIYFQF